MAQTTLFPLVNYPNGTRAFGPTSIGDAITLITLAVQRCTDADLTIWPNATTTLSLTVQQSNDAGTTWRDLAGFTAQGGIALNDDGTQAPTSFISLQPNPGTSRQLRGNVTVAGGPLRSSGTLTTS